MLKANTITGNVLTIAGPIAFTTTPTMITQAAGTNSTSAATTAYVDGAITNLRASNNIWEGSNTFNGITLSSPITLGTSSTLPSIGLNQMGGISVSPTLLTTTIGTSNTAIAISPVIVAGTYLVRWSLQIRPDITTGQIAVSVGTDLGIVSCGTLDFYIPVYVADPTIVRNGMGFYSTTVSTTTLTLWASSLVAASTCYSSNFVFNLMRIC